MDLKKRSKEQITEELRAVECCIKHQRAHCLLTASHFKELLKPEVMLGFDFDEDWDGNEEGMDWENYFAMASKNARGLYVCLTYLRRRRSSLLEEKNYLRLSEKK